MTQSYIRSLPDPWGSDDEEELLWWPLMLWRSNTGEPFKLSWFHHFRGEMAEDNRLFRIGYRSIAGMARDYTNAHQHFVEAFEKPTLFRFLLLRAAHPPDRDCEIPMRAFRMEVNDDPEYQPYPKGN